MPDVTTIGRPRPLHIIIAYFLIYVVWGSTYYFIGVALKGIPLFLLGALRFSMAGLLLLGWCKARGEAIFRRELLEKAAVSGIILLYFDMAVIMVAQQYISSSLIAIIASSSAIWIMLLDIPMWGRNFRSPVLVAGIITGFLGVLLLYIEQYYLSDGKGTEVRGMYVLVLGCISWALGTLYTKYFLSKAENSSSFAGSGWQMLFAAGMFWIFSILSGEVGRVNIAAVPATAWWSLGYLVIFGSILAYSAYIWLLKVRPATEVATHAYVNPLIAIVLGVTFGGENVSYIQLFGLGIILLSVTLVTCRNST